MNVLFFCTTWGQKQSGWAEFFSKVVTAGYDGVETSLPSENETDEFVTGLQQHNLAFIGQHWETATSDFDAHIRSYEQVLGNLAAMRPLLINSHTGKDYFRFEQNRRLINLATTIEADSGVPITHETHRGRFAFAAHVTANYLHALPELKLTLDISHWCNVAESLLQDQQEAVNVAIAHTAHIHARIGFEQGPQVFDPTDEVSADALRFHLECWDKIIERQKQLGTKQMTITTEFGPSPYMPGRQPAENQWIYNVQMLRLLKERYTD
ncbi:sugar phosphate isomerase/epimerase family protein [Spirosoma litoris]